MLKISSRKSWVQNIFAKKFTHFISNKDAAKKTWLHTNIRDYILKCYIYVIIFSNATTYYMQASIQH